MAHLKEVKVVSRFIAVLTVQRYFPSRREVTRRLVVHLEQVKVATRFAAVSTVPRLFQTKVPKTVLAYTYGICMDMAAVSPAQYVGR